MLQLFAQGLAGEGIAAARVDKRGMFGSANALLDGTAVAPDDVWSGLGLEQMASAAPGTPSVA